MSAVVVRRSSVWLLAILIVAAALRLPGLGKESLWGDESLTVQLARMNLFDLVKYDTWFEQIPPVHHIVVHFWIKLFGDSEASVRMPSAIAGIAGVWLTYVLVRRLMGRRVGLLAAALLAVNPMHIAYSQECRTYALHVVMCLLSCDVFVRLIRRPSNRLHAAWVVTSALVLYTHLFGVFTIGAQQLFYFWMLWRSRGRLPLGLGKWIGDNFAVAALYAAWVPVVIRWSRAVSTNFWVKKVTFDDVTRAYWVFSGATPVFLAVMALLVIAVWRWRRRAGFVMLLIVMLTPIVVPVTISVLTRPSFAPRYGIFATVGLCGVAAAGLAAIRPMPLRAMALLALMIASPLGDAARIPRAQWREVAQWLEQNMRPGDLCVVHLRAGTRLYDYYVKRTDVRRLGVDTPNLPVSYPMEPRRVWLVIYDPWYPGNVLLRNAPVRVGKRIWTWGVYAMELVEDPDRYAELGLPPPTTRPAE
jgi:4-amino-4-deoxy-L-arabinose transferase-like glycosyltransferase